MTMMSKFYILEIEHDGSAWVWDSKKKISIMDIKCGTCRGINREISIAIHDGDKINRKLKLKEEKS